MRGFDGEATENQLVNARNRSMRENGLSLEEVKENKRQWRKAIRWLVKEGLLWKI
jgi:hypothetical protein